MHATERRSQELQESIHNRAPLFVENAARWAYRLVGTNERPAAVSAVRRTGCVRSVLRSDAAEERAFRRAFRDPRRSVSGTALTLQARSTSDACRGADSRTSRIAPGPLKAKPRMRFYRRWTSPSSKHRCADSHHPLVCPARSRRCGMKDVATGIVRTRSHRT